MPGGGKNADHNGATTKKPHDNGPEQHLHLSSLRPQRLMPEKEFSQQTKGGMVWLNTYNMWPFPEIATTKSI
jgi:hypothetical protein